MKLLTMLLLPVSSSLVIHIRQVWGENLAFYIVSISSAIDGVYDALVAVIGCWVGCTSRACEAVQLGVTTRVHRRTHRHTHRQTERQRQIEQWHWQSVTLHAWRLTVSNTHCATAARQLIDVVGPLTDTMCHVDSLQIQVSKSFVFSSTVCRWRWPIELSAL